MAAERSVPVGRVGAAPMVATLVPCAARRLVGLDRVLLSPTPAPPHRRDLVALLQSGGTQQQHLKPDQMCLFTGHGCTGY